MDMEYARLLELIRNENEAEIEKLLNTSGLKLLQLSKTQSRTSNGEPDKYKTGITICTTC